MVTLRKHGKYYKILLNGKKNGEIGEIEIEGVSVRDKPEIPNKMNEFYVSSVVKINQSIERSRVINENLPSVTCTFDFKNVCMYELQRCLKEMKNKNDTDFVSPLILMDAWPIIGTTVCQGNNESLNESFPNV